MRAAIEEQSKQLQSLGLDLGFVYEQGALVSDGSPVPPWNPAHYVPSGRPGSRAPHVNVVHEDREISLLDLFDGSFVLLVGREGGAWFDAATELLLTVQQVANSDLRALYGVGEGGAVLVRPDGVVGWRSPSLLAKPKEALKEAFSAILSS